MKDYASDTSVSPDTIWSVQSYGKFLNLIKINNLIKYILY